MTLPVPTGGDLNGWPTSIDERRIAGLHERFPTLDLRNLEVALAVGRASVAIDRALAERVAEPGGSRCRTARHQGQCELGPRTSGTSWARPTPRRCERRTPTACDGDRARARLAARCDPRSH